MPYGLIDYNTLKNISNALRKKSNSESVYYPRDMANAIAQLSFMGFDEPVIPSMKQFILNNADYSRYNFPQCIGFEFTNNIPVDKEHFFKFGEEDWEMSPSKVTLYGYPSSENVLIVQNANFVGVADAGQYFLRNNNRINTFNINGELYTARLGDVIVNGSNYYLEWCNNRLYNYYTNDFETGWAELPVAQYTITGEPFDISGDLYYSRMGVIYGFGYDDSFDEGQFSIIDMSKLFKYPQHLPNYTHSAFSGKFTKYMIETYNGCSNITGAACGPNVVNMSNCYYGCTSLREAVCGNSVKTMMNAYRSCSSLLIGTVGPNVINAANAYESCYLMSSVVGNANNLKYGMGMFYGCANLTDVPDFPALENSYLMFQGCFRLNKLPSCPNLIYGEDMFSGIVTLTEQNVQDFLNNATSLKDMTSMFDYGNQDCYVNLLNIRIPEHVESINRLYSSDSRYYVNNNGIMEMHDWVGNTAYCPDTVKYIAGLYSNKNQIIYPACGNSVIDMSNAYTYCYRIVEPVCGPNVKSMNYAYLSCSSITEPVCGNNVEEMVYTYSGCMNIVNAVCGPNVVNMYGTYGFCYNLINATIGPNVKSISYAYQSCYNLIEPVCTDTVVNMSNAYDNCANLSYAVCGENVVNMYSAYRNCRKITDAVCGNNVAIMDYAFFECYNLTGNAACGINVTNMAFAYQRCNNLENAYIGPNVKYSYCAYSYCNNLRHITALGDVAQAFSSTNLSNVETITLGENAVNLSSTFQNARQVTDISLPENVYALNSAFYNCVNLSSDIYIGNNCKNMFNAFYGCNNIQNIYIDGSYFSNLTYDGPVRNAFYRNNYSIQRNIVIGNRNGYNRMLQYNLIGYASYVNTEYENPVEVNVNGVTYYAERSSYNESYNVYIYCTE